jgi:hypothetical protein
VISDPRFAGSLIYIVAFLTFLIWSFRRVMKSVRVRISEISALWWVAANVESNNLSDESRILLESMKIKTDPWMPDEVRFAPKELAVLTPFIDEKLQAYSVDGSASSKRIATLTKFKKRMLRQGFWPHCATHPD